MDNERAAPGAVGNGVPLRDADNARDRRVVQGGGAIAGSNATAQQVHTTRSTATGAGPVGSVAAAVATRRRIRSVRSRSPTSLLGSSLRTVVSGVFVGGSRVR